MLEEYCQYPNAEHSVSFGSLRNIKQLPFQLGGGEKIPGCSSRACNNNQGHVNYPGHLLSLGHYCIMTFFVLLGLIIISNTRSKGVNKNVMSCYTHNK